jgi:two-component system invasion response regulator UvrY
MRHVLIADDSEVTRRGICQILRDAFGGVETIEVSDADEVVSHAGTRPWDLILLDILMPGPSVLDVLHAIRAAHPTVPILVLTAATEIEYVVQTLKAGANGLIHKHRASDDLIDAIRRVSVGGTYLHPETAMKIAVGLRDAKPSPLHEKLSARELEIFRLIALGRTVKEIAGDLSLSDKTVATYLGRIREKTGLMNHVEIARYALKHGVVA